MSGAVVALLLAVAIQHGLLGHPDMQVRGNGSSASALRWFVDRSDSTLRTAWVVSVPMLVYRGAMLAWALWVAGRRGAAGGPWRRHSRPGAVVHGREYFALK